MNSNGSCHLRASNSIGSVLKEARTKKTLSLDEVHSKIKIHPDMLKLLEEDQFEKLPSPLFVKSFLKIYGQFLEVNSEELVSAYEKEKREYPEQVLYIKPADSALGAGYRPVHVIVGMGAALFLLFVLLGQPSQLVKSWATLFEPKKKIAETSLADKSKKTISPKIDNFEWLNNVRLGNFPKIDLKAPLSLEIKVLDVVWLRVTCDGHVVFQGILKKGATKTWPAKDAIELWTGNASNMSLVLNKTFLGSPGKGVVKKMLISRDGVRIASSPKLP